MTQETTLQIVNPVEYGIEEKKANELIGNLPQIIEERSALEKRFAEVIKMDIESPDSASCARELRLLVQKNRTQGINVWHRTTKDFFLKGGQFVDAIKRKEVAVNERMEADLTEIEKYAEIKEQKRLAELQKQRAEQLSKYVDDAFDRNLSGMDDDVWDAYIETKKKEYNDRIEANKKAEAERIAREKSEAEERERIRNENERLKKEAEEREKAMAEERAKAEAERIAIEEKARKEREEAERKAREEREKQEAILKAEREKAAKIEAEIRAKAEAEAKAKADEEEKQRQLQLAPDKEKLSLLAEQILNINMPELKSKKSKAVVDDVKQLLQKVANHIVTKIENL